MKVISIFLVAIIIALSFPLNITAQTERGQNNKKIFKDNEIIIKFKQNQTPDDNFQQKYKINQVQKLIERHKFNDHQKAENIKKIGLDRLYKANINTQTNINDIIRELKSDPSVEYAEPNFIYNATLIPNDPSFSQLWGLNNTGQTGGSSNSDINAPEAWDTAKDTNIIVGVIDTGVDYNHEDLSANIWTNPGEIPGNNIDDDNNGFIDDVHGWDFVNDDNDPMDDHGHGTHVAGTIGAQGNNGIGVVGVNWQAKIAALKFLGGDGYGATDDAVSALLYANLMGFKITNNSWGGGGYSQALYDAISATNTIGGLFIAAAGNSSFNMDVTPDYPASYDLPNVISVAATDHSDNIAYFSNYGLTTVDLGAPGVNIYSTVPKGSCVLCSSSGYTSLSGTSMASPHVSGAAALIWNAKPNLSNQDVKNLLMNTSDPVNSLLGKTVTGARLNIYNNFDNDSTPPASVSNLTSPTKSFNSINLSWTAQGDDGSSGKASKYDIRYSTSPITEANFSSANVAPNLLQPSNPGTTENFKVSGLSANTTYYFALKTIDNVGNKSSISNIASNKTLTPYYFYTDNMEGASTSWTIAGTNGANGLALWHRSTKRNSSPTTSWYYGKEDTSTYNTGFANSGSITSPSINLAGSSYAELTFSHFLATENNISYDKAGVQISPDNGTTWNTVASKNPTNGTWVKEVIDLSSYNNKTIKIRFVFDTVDAFLNDFEGWYIDDVIVQGQKTTQTPTANAGPDKTGIVGQSLSFSGAGSTDSDGTITQYNWNFGDNTSATGQTVNHTYNSTGTYTVTLTVTDNDGLTSNDTALVTISNNNTPVTIFSDSFEVSEWNNLWTEDTQNDWSRSRQRATLGKYGAEVDGEANDSQLRTNALNLQGKTNAKISFNWYIEDGFDAGEYVAFDVSTDNGVTWVEKARIRGNVDQENKWTQVNTDLTNINNLRLRFRAKVSSSTEDANLDQVTVQAY